MCKTTDARFTTFKTKKVKTRECVMDIITQ